MGVVNKGGDVYDCARQNKKAVLIVGAIDTAESEYLYPDHYKSTLADIRIRSQYVSEYPCPDHYNLAQGYLGDIHKTGAIPTVNERSIP